MYNWLCLRLTSFTTFLQMKNLYLILTLTYNFSLLFYTWFHSLYFALSLKKKNLFSFFYRKYILYYVGDSEKALLFTICTILSPFIYLYKENWKGIRFTTLPRTVLCKTYKLYVSLQSWTCKILSMIYLNLYVYATKNPNKIIPYILSHSQKWRIFHV